MRSRPIPSRCRAAPTRCSRRRSPEPPAGAGGDPRPIGPITQVTGILYTLPSLAVFFLLLPITGRGNTTAIIALVAYSLLIIFRNVIAGLDNVPAEAKDAGRGMGLTDRQLLWRVA